MGKASKITDNKVYTGQMPRSMTFDEQLQKIGWDRNKLKDGGQDEAVPGT